MKIIFVGPPGSGKGTQTELLSSKYSIPVFSPGKLFRKEITESSVLGLKIKKFTNNGELIPESLMREIVEKNVSDNMILDGFPRNLKQLDMLEGETLFFFLQISKEKLIDRLLNRRICTGCKQTTNLILDPTKEQDKCNLCGNKLIKREDDNEEIIERRFQVFVDETVPMLNATEFITIDATKSVLEVFNQILKKVKC